MKPGNIIFLNGTSSSGKSTIAKELQEKLEDPYMHASIDGFFYLYPKKFLQTPDKFKLIFEPVVSGFHGAVAVFARAGNHIIVDHLMEQDGWLKDCLEKWAGLNVLFVGVKCPIDILEQREKDRGDRKIGLARFQIERVHIHDLYDLEVDTSILSPEECADKIMEKLQQISDPSAFQILAKTYI